MFIPVKLYGHFFKKTFIACLTFCYMSLQSLTLWLRCFHSAAAGAYIFATFRPNLAALYSVIYVHTQFQVRSP